MAGNYRKGSLKSRILIGFTLTFGVTIMLSMAFVYYNFQSMVKDTIRIGAVNLTSSMTEKIRSQISMIGDVDSLQRFSLDLSKVVESASMVDYIRIVSDDLRVLASPNLAETGKVLEGTPGLHERLLEARGETRIVEEEGQPHVIIPVKNEDPAITVYMLVSYEQDYMSQNQWSLLNRSLLAAIIALLIAAATTYWLFNTYIEKPLVEISLAFKRVRHGELDTSLPDFETEEFSETSRSITELFSIIQSASVSLQRMVRTTHEQTGKITALLDRFDSLHQEQVGASDQTRSSMEVFRGAVRKNEAIVGRLNIFAEDTSSSVLEMLSSLEEVDEQMASLNKIIDDTLGKTSDMSEGFSEVTHNTQELAKESDELASAIMEIIQSIHSVEQYAATNRDLSQKAADHAREGVNAVGRSTEGMQAIKDSVTDMGLVISTLGVRAEEIETILKVINQIAEKTNLLALNAAIIAAQAGEHGRSFSVVADEIRELASQTSNSTRDIEEKVTSVQDETSRVIAKMRESLKHVDAGESRLNETVETLNAILNSSVESDEMSKTIAVATVEQAKVSRQIGEVTNRIQSYLHQIAQSMKSQEVSANQLTKSSEQVRDLSISVQRATQEQREGVSRLNSQIESVYELSQDLKDDAKTSAQESGRLDDAISTFLHAAGDASRLLVELNKQFQVLVQDSSRIDTSLEFLSVQMDDMEDGQNRKPQRPGLVQESTPPRANS